MILSIAVVSFGYGVAVWAFQIFPYEWLASTGQTVSQEFVPHHIRDAYYEQSGVKTVDPDAVSPGVTLLTGYWKEFEWRPGIKLIDSSGKVLHRWKTDPSEIWPESPHNDQAAGKMNQADNYVHGSYLFENGDVLFNIEYLGLVRMNAKGEVVWKLPFRTHHSVARDEAGNFWVCGMQWLEHDNERLERFPGLKAPINEDLILQVSEDGEILREISLLDSIYQSGYEKAIWQTQSQRDVLHANDVEPLPQSIADSYALFDAGDLVVSCREISAVFVVGAESGLIKWFSRDFCMQHDPDFIGQGEMLVFDNNTHRPSEENRFGGSEIVKVNPETGTRTVVYPTSDDQDFFTFSGGKLQKLSNGNMLITEARRARVFEIDSSGRTVWEWIAERFDEKRVPEILEGTRYPYTPEQISRWSS